jgi:hypothetical protein
MYVDHTRRRFDDNRYSPLISVVPIVNQVVRLRLSRHVSNDTARENDLGSCSKAVSKHYSIPIYKVITFNPFELLLPAFKLAGK